MILLMDDSDVNFVAARFYEAQVAPSGIYFVPGFDFARQTRPNLSSRQEFR
jgi:hypothetical protein